MDVINNIVSGSAVLDKSFKLAGIEDPPVGGLLMMPGGGVKLMITDADDGKMSIEEWTNMSTCLTFLMYSLSRKDWMLEYMSYEKELEDIIEDGFKDIERNRVKNSLRVIVGGKTDAEEEIGNDPPVTS